MNQLKKLAYTLYLKYYQKLEKWQRQTSNPSFYVKLHRKVEHVSEIIELLRIFL